MIDNIQNSSKMWIWIRYLFNKRRCLVSYKWYIYNVLAVWEVPMGHYMDFILIFYMCIYVPGSHIISVRILITVNYYVFWNGMAPWDILTHCLMLEEVGS